MHLEVKVTFSERLRSHLTLQVRGRWITTSEAVTVLNKFKRFPLIVTVVPLVQISVWSGMSIESKRKIVKGITQVFEEIGIPKEAVEIIIYEAPKTNWASGGELHSDSEKLAKIKVP